MEARHVRRVFNELGLEQRAARGELREVVREVKFREPVDGDLRARQEVVQWWDDHGLVAIVHRWFDQSGAPAASTRPDPKWVRSDLLAYGVAGRQEKHLPEHDYRRIDSTSFKTIAATWIDRASKPMGGRRCANCGWWWLEILALETDALFHAEAATIDEILAID